MTQLNLNFLKIMNWAHYYWINILNFKSKTKQEDNTKNTNKNAIL